MNDTLAAQLLAAVKDVAHQLARISQHLEQLEVYKATELKLLQRPEKPRGE